MSDKIKKVLKLSLKTEIWPILIVLTAIFISLITYRLLPDRVITHWNFAGEADGWSSRNFHIIFFPALISILYLIFNFLPSLDPKKERYSEFNNIYLIIRNLILFFMLIIFGTATAANLGYPINIGIIVPSAVGFLLLIMGNYLGKIKRNWFFGIRNPWTISSENSWNKTHRLGGKIFILWGLIMMISPWLYPKLALILLLIGVFSVLVIINLYSFIIYKKETDKKSSQLK